MAKRRTPKINRSRQQTAIAAISTPPVEATRKRRTRAMTMAQINAMRTNGGAVRLGIAKKEYGASGTMNVYGQIFNEDYNEIFDGKNGLAIYDQMYRSDAQLGAATDIIMQPIRAARWHAEYPENPSTQEKAITDSLNQFLFENGEWPDGESWDFYLRHLLLRVPFGFGFVEPVWIFDEDEGLLRWSRLAPRLPRTVDKFNVWDDGTLQSIDQYVSAPGTAHFEKRTIPAAWYTVISVRERLGDNYFGQSIYRRLYKHWFYKDDAYRIDGVRLDRYGVGIPVAKLDAEYVVEADELDEIETTLIAMRSHERAYIIEPAGVTFRIMTPENGQGGVTGLMDSVKHHNQEIVSGVLATFLGDHAEGLNTNRTRTLADIFLHALRSEANGIAGDVRSQLIRRWCFANFDMTDVRVPLLVVQGIGDMTIEQYAAALQPLVTAGLITPEDDLENALRKMLGLAPLPDGWKRGAAKPQAPQPGDGNGDPNPDDDAQGREDGPEPTDQDPNELAQSLRALANAFEKHEAPVINVPAPQIIVAGNNGSKRIERDLNGRIVRIIPEGS